MAVIIDGDLGVDKIKDGSVVNADLATGIDAAKLTGTLPALDASSLTDIPAPDALSTASGSAPSYSARAWVNFNGTGTVAIRESGNVSSITDNGTGDYTVNFTTAMPDSNYSSNMSVNFSRTIGSSRLNASLRTRNTSNIRMQSIGDDGNSYDSEDVDISVFR